MQNRQQLEQRQPEPEPPMIVKIENLSNRGKYSAQNNF